MEKFLPHELLVVNGARHHAENIQHLIKENAKGALSYDCMATLIREPENPYDPNAIAVTVSSLRVGYISAQTASKVKTILGDTTKTLNCTLLWNGNPDVDYSLYTIQLFN